MAPPFFWNNEPEIAILSLPFPVSSSKIALLPYRRVPIV